MCYGDDFYDLAVKESTYHGKERARASENFGNICSKSI